jgi:hypothetical protein
MKVGNTSLENVKKKLGYLEMIRTSQNQFKGKVRGR